MYVLILWHDDFAHLYKLNVFHSSFKQQTSFVLASTIPLKALLSFKASIFNLRGGLALQIFEEIRRVISLLQSTNPSFQRGIRCSSKSTKNNFRQIRACLASSVPMDCVVDSRSWKVCQNDLKRLLVDFRSLVTQKEFARNASAQKYK